MFSIVIPTYNRADKLKIALESLVRQTYKEFEVLVCDDGSTDNTNEIVDSFRDQLDITYIKEKNWGGPARPRNNGIKTAKFDWICFLDSDDWWYNNKLETCLPYIEHYDFLYHNMRIYNEKGSSNKLLKSRKLRKNVFNDLIINHNTIINSTVVVKRSLILLAGMLDENKKLIAIEDFDLWLRIARISNKFHLIPLELGGYYYDNIENISSSISKRIDYELLLFKKYEKFIPRNKYKLAKVNLFKNLAVCKKLINREYTDEMMFVIKHGTIKQKIWVLYYFFIKNIRIEIPWKKEK